MSSGDILETCTSDEKTGDPAPVSGDLMEVFSDFGDENCGEPEISQHLVLDFTPDPEIDNEIAQKKISDFWNFLNSIPEIQNLKVKPECEKPIKASTPSERLERPYLEENVVDMTKTACSMLEVVEEKDLISRAFEPRMPRTVCSLPTHNEEKTIKQKHRSIICKCKPGKPCKSCPAKKPSALKELCTKLKQWDDKHPKSMDPPTHAPLIQHCILQRQVFEF